MKPILFNFDAMSGGKDKALRDISRLFEKAGAPVVSSSVDDKVTRRAGVAFRNVNLTFADGQTVTFGVKETGDIFEVRINNSVVPLREQDNPTKSIAEIALLLDKRRAAFQRAMARVKVPLPPSVRVNRKTLMDAKVNKRDGLREAVKTAKEELSELTGTSA